MPIANSRCFTRPRTANVTHTDIERRVQKRHVRALVPQKAPELNWVPGVTAEHAMIS
jgi:hypothetical protein